jgi:hypothetical protein
MAGEWLLIETLGPQPAVVAVGRAMKNFVPVPVFLRRNPDLPTISAAITQTVTGATGLTRTTARGNRLIGTAPVIMTDGVTHGVQLWCGPAEPGPPQRPLIGAYTVDLDTGESAVTEQFLVNIGKDPATEPLTGRSMADDIPAGAFNEGEAMALSWTVDLAPGRTFAANWALHDGKGLHRRVGFCVRISREPAAGAERLLGRSMNLLETVGATPVSNEHLTARLIDAMARPGHYRAIIDLNTWRLIKWIDEPCPLYDWRATPAMHPDDHARLATPMAEELSYDQTTAVLRLPANGGGWTPIHLSIHRVELATGVYAGLVTLRQPTPEELSAAGQPPHP